MEKRWASVKLTLLLLYVGALPLLPDVPLPLAFVLVALAVGVVVPLVARCVLALVRQSAAPDLPPGALSVAAPPWQLFVPATSPALSTARPRAPSVLLAAHR